MKIYSNLEVRLLILHLRELGLRIDATEREYLITEADHTIIHKWDTIDNLKGFIEGVRYARANNSTS